MPNADAATVAALVKNELPAATPAKFDDAVRPRLPPVESSAPETEITAALVKIKPAELAESLEGRAGRPPTAFDNATKSSQQGRRTSWTKR